MFIDVWRLYAAIPCVCVCETKIAICNRWELEEFLNDMQARIQSFLEAFSLFPVFSVETKPKQHRYI